MTNQSKTVQSAVSFAKADGLSASAVVLLAESLGTAPTFDQWESTRVEWAKAYGMERKANEEASAKAWQRIAAQLSAQFALEKPKAPSKAATKKADSRAKAAESKADTLKALGVPEGATLDQITPVFLAINKERADAIAKGDLKALEGISKKAEAIDAAHKAAFKAASKAQADKAKAGEKADRDALAKWAKDAPIADVRKVLASIQKAAKKAA